MDNNFFISSPPGFWKENECNNISCWKHIDSMNISVNSSKWTFFVSDDFSFNSCNKFKEFFQKFVKGELDSFSTDFIKEFFSTIDDNMSTFSMAFSKRDIIWSIFSDDIFDEGKRKEFNEGEIKVAFLSDDILKSDIFNKVFF